MKKYILGIFLLITGCTRHESVGYVFPENYSSKLHLGKTTESQVLDIMGSPSVTSDYGDRCFYYVAQKLTYTPFSKRKLVEQHVLALKFNKGVLVDLQRYDSNKPSAVAIDKARTKLPGHEMGIFEQMIHNIGRFKGSSKGQE